MNAWLANTDVTGQFGLSSHSTSLFWDNAARHRRTNLCGPQLMYLTQTAGMTQRGFDPNDMSKLYKASY